MNKLIKVWAISTWVLFVFIVLLSNCSPTEPELYYPQYDVSPRAGAIPFNQSYTIWAGVIHGTLYNTSDDTLRNVAMQFTIKDAEGDSILSQSIGYFTLDVSEFQYYVAYPYKKVFNLAPNVRYHFWSASDTMRIYTWDATWLFTPIIKLPDGTSYSMSEEIMIESVDIQFARYLND